MGVFDDKKFEGLDWISQATEPIDSELNEILGAIPEEINLDFETYSNIATSYSMNLSLEKCISFLVQKYGNGRTIGWENRGVLDPCFEIQMDDEVTLNFETKQITGRIAIVKIQSTLDEKVLEGLLGQAGIASVSQMYFNGPGVGRANEIMELLGGCQDGLRGRSERKKRHIIKNRLIKLFKANEWKIKDTELANKVGYWIRDYIVDGNLAAFSNFCRLKVMTHKGDPIYSMEEVK